MGVRCEVQGGREAGGGQNPAGVSLLQKSPVRTKAIFLALVSFPGGHGGLQNEV